MRIETNQALMRVLGNLCGEGAKYNWTCLNEDEGGDPRCASSATKCVWCEARDVLCEAEGEQDEGVSA